MNRRGTNVTPNRVAQATRRWKGIWAYRLAVQRHGGNAHIYPRPSGYTTAEYVKLFNRLNHLKD